MQKETRHRKRSCSALTRKKIVAILKKYLTSSLISGRVHAASTPSELQVPDALLYAIAGGKPWMYRCRQDRQAKLAVWKQRELRW